MKIAFALCLLGSAVSVCAQAPGTVKWRAIAEPVNGEGVLVVNLASQIEKGWHIYAQTQSAGGPTPLRITIEPGTPYEIAGSITGTAPQKHHDASFDLDTEFYTDSFVLKIPVKTTTSGATGVPLAIKFQMCSDTTCMPPKTIHIVAQTPSSSASALK